MKITYWPIESIIRFARNARKIPPQAVDKVAASIKEFGWRVPIVVDKDGVIICGHTRLLAARKLGLQEAPVHVADNLTPAQVRAYRLLDNRSHEETSWDEDLLGLELLDLKGMGVDLDLTGFNTDEIDEYLARAERGAWRTDEDAVPEVPEVPVSAAGDLWVLGPHRLLCGDATVAASYQTVLAGGRADMTFTDPPYGVDYVGKTKKKLKLQNDNLGSNFEIFLRDACANLLGVTKGPSTSVCPPRNWTRCRKRSPRPAVIGRPSSSGRRTRSRWVGPITSANTNRFFMAGRKGVRITGAERGTRVTSGSSTARTSMTCIPR
jgi:hypothetical protein